MSATVLIVGGGGVFGCRLAEGLRATTSARIIMAGRSSKRAEAAARAVAAHGSAVIDRAHAEARDLRELGVDIVVDAAGPFQGADLGFARAVLEAGAHYVDLADARDFVAAFPTLDALARAQGKAAITGASSTPALTHAALDALCAGWTRIDAIRAGIAPGNRAPKGRSLIAAILSRAGSPTCVFQDGAWRDLPGWLHQATLAVEGLGRRRFALVETPDLDLIVARFAPTDEALFLAGLELGLLQRGIEFLGALRRWRVWRTPERAAGAFALAARLVEPFGSDCGAMFVEATGRDASDRPSHARWTMIAPAGRGPYGPTLPALAMVRKIIAGGVAPGARACVGLVSFAELAADFQRLGFTTEVRREALISPFERALGAAFERAPAAVKQAHRAGPVTRMVGRAEVKAASTPLAALAGLVMGFPRAAAAAPLRVIKRMESGGSEIWTRRVGGRTFKSTLSCPAPNVVRERFGPFVFDLKVSAEPAALSMEIEAWRLGWLPLPRSWAPRSLATETEDAAGRFFFNVPILAPLVGLLTHYRGALALETQAGAVEEGPHEIQSRQLP